VEDFTRVFEKRQSYYLAMLRKDIKRPALC